MARVIAGLVVFAAFAALLVSQLMREVSVECEVCVEYAGRTACRTNLAASRDAAIAGAQSTACAVLAGGVTRGIQCTSTRPTSIHCSD
jgi:hypothetical protein